MDDVRERGRREEAWTKVLRRLQSVTPERGQSVITLRLYTSNGLPCKWAAPQVTALEPKADSFLEAVLGALTGDTD